MKQFYTHDGKEQKGPFDINDFLKLSINEKTPVWYEGLVEWTTAGEVEELKDLFKKVTPPPFRNTQVPPPININQKNEASIPENKKNKTGIRKPVLTLSLILVIFVGCFIILNNNNQEGGYETSYAENVMSVEEIERSRPTDFLSAAGTYQKNLWGDKFKVKCEITNRATVATYKDAIVRVKYYSKTNTELGIYDYPVYEMFSPTSTRTVEFKVDNYKDVSSISLSVISATAK